MAEWHEKDIKTVIAELSTGEKGLSSEEAASRQLTYGKNVLPEKKRQTDVQLLIEQFKNFLVLILVVAAGVSFALGEVLDGAAIIAIVILNALFGFFQEKKAEKTLEALKKFAAQKCKVMRDGDEEILDAPDLVPGDILVLEVGDKVPADGRIVENVNLKLDESVLTGESNPVTKDTSTYAAETPVADRKNMLFSGTTVVYGRCTAVVTSIGAETEFGKIASSVQGADDTTPLQKKMESLGKQLGAIVLVISVVVFFAGLLHGIEILDIFLTAVSLAVAAIPEGLPAVVTITLAIGLTRMVKKNAIIRKLNAVETLGSTTVICTDKTGTLTKNEMTVRKIYVSNRTFEVTGEGYEIKGDVLLNGQKVEGDRDVGMVLAAGMLCNNAHIGREHIGDPTELALLVAAEKFVLHDIRETEKREKEIEFDSERKMMSVVYNIDGRRIMYTKGAVEEVLGRCRSIYLDGAIRPMAPEDRSRIMAKNEEMARSALRILAFATRKLKDEEATENDLIFIGLQGMMDPPRPEAKEAIDKCSTAGIKVVMITGDHKDTAVAIATELGMLPQGGNVLTGAEMDKMTDDEFAAVAAEVYVYARVSPQHKLKITDALKKKGHVVAMTGDGVNDAPALKKADIGIAMGVAGTDVAKEASDMVLTDDNFASIVSAVEEGRGIYDNIKKFINYLLSCNIAEVLVIFLALIFIRDPATGAFVLPLLPIQILWMNLVTDGLPAIALGMEPYEEDIMKRRPRDPKEKVLDRRSLEFIFIVGLLITLMTLYLFQLQLPDEPRARTIAFTSLVVLEMAVALSFRNPHYFYGKHVRENKLLWISLALSLVLQVIIVQVPLFNPVFDTVPLEMWDWAMIITAALAVFVVIELNKILRLHDRIFRLVPHRN